MRSRSFSVIIFCGNTSKHRGAPKRTYRAAAGASVDAPVSGLLECSARSSLHCEDTPFPFSGDEREDAVSRFGPATLAEISGCSPALVSPSSPAQPDRFPSLSCSDGRPVTSLQLGERERQRGGHSGPHTPPPSTTVETGLWASLGATWGRRPRPQGRAPPACGPSGSCHAVRCRRARCLRHCVLLVCHSQRHPDAQGSLKEAPVKSQP